MKKQVVYQITRKHYQIVEVETEEQEQIIKELNRDFEREEKRRKTFQARYMSLESLLETEGREPILSEKTIEEAFIEKIEKTEINGRLRKAVDRLSLRQQEIIIKVFFEDKSQAEVAKELGVTEGTVSITMERALRNLKKFLEKK